MSIDLAARIWLAEYAHNLKLNPLAIHMSLNTYVASGGASMVADAIREARRK